MVSAEATNVAIPTVKAITGWSPSAIGIWSLIAIQLFVVAGVIVKNGPAWITAWSNSRAQDAKTQNEQDAALESRVAALETRAQRSESVNMYLTGATTLLLTALRTVDPSNPAIFQANQLVEMAVAAGGADGVFTRGLAQLATVKGVGE